MCIQFFGNERFLYIVIGTDFITFYHIFRRYQGRGEQNRSFPICLADTLHHLVTVHNGHFYIRYYHIRMLFFPLFQALLAIGGSNHFITAYHIFQPALNYISQACIVFYQQ